MSTAPVLAIVGATATGKSALAMAIAQRADDIEVVSADAMQVYRGLDIGTAKPTAADRAAVPHHLLDVADPWESFSLARYLRLAEDVLADIDRRGRRAVLVGGTGLYVRGVVDHLDVPGQFPHVRAELEMEPDTEALHARLRDLDPVAAGRMESSNRRRIVRALEVTLGAGRPFSSFGPGLAAYPPIATGLIGLSLPPGELDVRIAVRVRKMVDEGFVDEVARLAAGPTLSATADRALGYRELLAHLDGACSLERAIEDTVARTRRFARRQLRWFRRDDRTKWLDARTALDELARKVLPQ